MLSLSTLSTLPLSILYTLISILVTLYFNLYTCAEHCGAQRNTSKHQNPLSIATISRFAFQIHHRPIRRRAGGGFGKLFYNYFFTLIVLCSDNDGYFSTLMFLCSESDGYFPTLMFLWSDNNGYFSSLMFLCSDNDGYFSSLMFLCSGCDGLFHFSGCQVKDFPYICGLKDCFRIYNFFQRLF